MGGGFENVSARCCKTGADGHSAAETFGKSQQGGRDAVMLVREPPAGAAESGLHLVEDQQQVVRVAPLADSGKVARRRRDDADLAHHGLEHHADRVLVGRRLDRVEVVVRHMHETFRQRCKRIRVLVLPAGGDGRESSSMKRTGGRDDLEGPVAIALPPLAGELDRRLVGFSARVTEEDARGERQLDEALRKLDLRLRVVEVGRVDEAARLRGERGHDVRMRVAEQVDGDAGDQVEILAPGVVVDKAASASHERDWQALAHLHEVAVRKLGRVHGVTIVPIPASVNSSSSRALGGRPSTVCASGTTSSARRHASSLAIMPPVTSPSATRWRASSRDITATTLPSTPMTPGTSVSSMTLAAFSETAISAATVSALMLYAFPS